MMLFLISVSMAQFEDFDQKIEDCQWSCCATYEGSWDNGLHECSFEGNAGELDYYECSNACLENRGKEIGGYGGGNLCGPGFLIFGLVLAVFSRP